MKFSENLVRYRKLKGHTQEEMAEKMQVSRQSVSKWENGEAVPELAKIIKLADILEVSLDVLCGREEEEQNILESGCESKNTKKKWNKVFLSVILAVVIVASGILGYSIGNSEKETQSADSEIYELPDTIEVEDVFFSLEKNMLTCEFVPSIYSEKLSYRIILIDDWAKKFYDVKFENGIGKASMIVGSYNTCNFFLEISNGEESRSVSLGKISVDSDNGKIIYK
ncbi:MAG: helix-turn-helix transcriptional regulator [Lachnospiraceae bacterium]|nr:helix-turn-helix transcriptional regulator [Lachnospiraceae bacterium]